MRLLEESAITSASPEGVNATPEGAANKAVAFAPSRYPLLENPPASVSTAPDASVTLRILLLVVSGF